MSTRETVRRAIEELRLGEVFDQYREAREGDSDARIATLREVIADAFTDAADWDEAAPME